MHSCTSQVGQYGCRCGTTNTFPQVNVSALTHPLPRNHRSKPVSYRGPLFFKTHARAKAAPGPRGRASHRAPPRQHCPTAPEARSHAHDRMTALSRPTRALPWLPGPCGNQDGFLDLRRLRVPRWWSSERTGAALVVGRPCGSRWAAVRRGGPGADDQVVRGHDLPFPPRLETGGVLGRLHLVDDLSGVLRRLVQQRPAGLR